MDVTQQHPHYADRAARAGFALAHYTGDLFERTAIAQTDDGATRTAVCLKGAPFLLRHQQGESDTAYAERRAVSTYTPHFAFAVDGLAGQVQANEDDAEREWEGSPLGDPEDAASDMARLWRDANGEGLDWPTVWHTMAPLLVTATRWGVLVEGDVEGSPYGRVTLIDPRDVIDWDDAHKKPHWVVLREGGHAAREPGDDAQAVERYLVVRLDGWTRYEADVAETHEVRSLGDTEVLSGGVPKEVDSGTWSFTDPSGAPCLPFRMVELPIGRELGYQMAHVANGIMNRQSTRDWRFWTACINRLHVDLGEDTQTTYEQITDGIRQHGTTLLLTRGGGSAGYIHPSQEPAEAAGRALESDVKEFYRTFFRAAADAARQRTATEIVQANDTGIAAFLVMLAGTLDEAENFALAMLEQVKSPGAEPVASVQRSTTFAPVSPGELADGLHRRYFGDAPVPAGAKARQSAAERITELDNVTADPKELETAASAEPQAPQVRPDRLAGLRAAGRFNPSLAGEQAA